MRIANGTTTSAVVCGVALVLLMLAAPALSDDVSSENTGLSKADINAIVDELQRRGMVVAAPAASENSQAQVGAVVDEMAARGMVVADSNPAVSEREESWTDRISLYGDFRGRMESFWYEDDRDRNRLRYRSRLGLKVEINDHVKFDLRLATGRKSRSGNQTLGRTLDFDPDEIFIDRAFITVSPFGKENPPVGEALAVKFGKMANPFKPKGMGVAKIMWDSDIMPEGVALNWSARPMDIWNLNLDAAYYVIDENHDLTELGLRGYKDPYMVALQLDSKLELSDHFDFNSQFSFYTLNKLDSAFFTRAGAFGNTAGLTGSNHINLFEFHGGVTFNGSEDWPVTLWGNVMTNTSAKNVGEGKQNLGWSTGLELGDKKKFVKLGVGYFEIEADAVPSMLTDSNIFDGSTNGEGWVFYVSRQIWKNTDLGVTVYVGDMLDDDVTHQPFSIVPEERTRAQWDVNIRF